MFHLLRLLPSVLLALLSPIIVGLPLMQVKNRTLESSSLTLQHKQGVSGSQYINHREALRLVLLSHMPISWTNPCCQREEVLWLVRPVWRLTGSPSQITHSEGEQSPSGSKTELTKFVFKGPCVSSLQFFLLLGTPKLWSMKKSCYIEDVFCHNQNQA